ncbi:MAG: molybdopterin-dependent oxidoreductase [Thermoplasmata archaeon]
MFSSCTRDCYDCCSCITRVKNGIITSVEGNREHPVTQGVICKRLRLFAKFVQSNSRLTVPLRRKGERGSDSFERITWDNATKEIAEKIMQVTRTHGSSSIALYDTAGNMGFLARYFPHRLINALNGSFNLGTLCSAAGSAALRYNFGSTYGYPVEAIPNARLIVLWGINSKWTNIHGSMLVQKAKKNHASVWVIDPIKTPTSEMGRHLQIRPGTDGALALAIINQLIQNEMHDSEFINKYVVGFDQLKQIAQKYDLRRASQITGLKEGDISELATEFVTLKPSVIHIGFGLQRHKNGGDMVRAISLIPSIVGQHRGFIYANGGADFDMSYLRGSHLRTSPESYYNPLELSRLISDGKIKFLMVINSNPLVTLPNQNALRKSILDSDIVIVTHDLFMTDTADFSDYVLPATSMFEHLDIVVSYYHDYLHINEPAIPPVGESKSNVSLFKLLSKSLGLKLKELYENEEIIIENLLRRSSRFSTDYLTLKKTGFCKAKPLPLDRYQTPSGKIEIYSESAARDGMSPIPDHSQMVATAPYQLLTPCTFEMNHSSYHLLSKELAPKILMNPKDALALSLKSGDFVIVENSDGAVKFAVEISDITQPGVLVSFNGLWPKLSGGSNVNFLTTDFIQKFGGNSAYNSTFVRISPASR